jgi:hypothetical protein
MSVAPTTILTSEPLLLLLVRNGTGLVYYTVQTSIDGNNNKSIANSEFHSSK